MAFDIKFTMQDNEPNSVQKSFGEWTTIQGTLKTDCAVIDPVIVLEYSGNAFPFNYAFIPIWGRYYFITGVVVSATGFWSVSMHVDVLTTYGNDLDLLHAYVARNENAYDYDLVDTRFPFENKIRSGYRIFPYQPFDVTDPITANLNLRYVLTTATTGSIHTTTDPTPIAPLIQPNSELLPFSLVTKSYAMNSTNAAKLINELLSIGTFEALVDGNKADGVVSLFVYPSDIPISGLIGYPGSPHVQVFNNKTLNIDGYEMCRNIINTKDFGTIDIPSNGFRGREPYVRYQLYLPYIGFTDLNAAEIEGSTIGVQYIIDYGTGRCNAVVTMKRGVATSKVIKILSGQIGIQIPISNTNASEVARNILNGITGFAASGASLAISAATGNAAGVIGSATGLISAGVGVVNNPTIMRGELPNPQLSFFMPQQCILYTLTQEVSSAGLTHYASYEGRPLMQERLLSSLTGYTEISRIHLTGIDALKSELDELESLLKSGVIFGTTPHYPA